MSKFKVGQEVVSLGITLNGDKIDINSIVVEDSDSLKHPGKYLILIHGHIFKLDENKLVDAVEYWHTKRMNSTQEGDSK